MTISPSDPQTILAIVFGASKWPLCDSLPSSAAFSYSARDFITYLKSEDGLSLKSDNILDLFDLDLSSDDIDSSISSFLSERQTRLKAAGSPATDLVFYYVGHGGFSSGGQDYFFAIRRTRERNQAVSSVRVADLATTLKRDGKDLRRYLIIDCCFAAAAFSQFQAGNITEGIREKTMTEFPRKGTALFCAASKQDFAVSPAGGSHTMFSGALLDILRHGDADTESPFSLITLARLVEDRIEQLYPNTAVRPQVLSPDSRQGDIAEIPLFPNVALKSIAASGGTENRQHVEQAEDRRQRLSQFLILGTAVAIVSIIGVIWFLWSRPPRKIVLRGVHFDFEKSNIRPGDAAVLDEDARTLKAHPDLKLHVVAYCDPSEKSEVPSLEGCVQFAQRRAAGVIDYLTKEGVKNDSLIPQAVVSSESDGTSEGHARNRRVELVPSD